MAVWVVRGGRKGEQQREQEALEKGLLAIRFAGMQKVDLTNTRTRDDVQQLYRQVNSHDSPSKTAQRVRALWLFRHKIQIGDLVVMPLKGKGMFAVGEVSGEYEYCLESSTSHVHCRRVEWTTTEVPRSSLSEKCNKSINRPPTVFDISAHAAEIESILGK